MRQCPETTKKTEKEQIATQCDFIPKSAKCQIQRIFCVGGDNYCLKRENLPIWENRVTRSIIQGYASPAGKRAGAGCNVARCKRAAFDPVIAHAGADGLSQSCACPGEGKVLARPCRAWDESKSEYRRAWRSRAALRLIHARRSMKISRRLMREREPDATSHVAAGRRPDRRRGKPAKKHQSQHRPHKQCVFSPWTPVIGA